MKLNWNDKDFIKEIINRCINNDMQAQEFLYRNFYSKFLPVCYRYAKNKNEALDIFHEGVVKVFKKLGSFGFNGSFEGWVRKIIVNTAIDFLRKKSKTYTQDLSFIDENIQDDDFPENYMENNEIINLITPEELISFIQQLPPSYRLAINLYVFENLTHKEIANLLGISENTSKTNYMKAKKKLKKLIEKKFMNK